MLVIVFWVLSLKYNIVLGEEGGASHKVPGFHLGPLLIPLIQFPSGAELSQVYVVCPYEVSLNNIKNDKMKK